MPSDQPERLAPAAFEALCWMLWGDGPGGWQGGAADHLGINARNVRFFAAEPPAASKPVPPGIHAEIVAEVRRRLDDPDARGAMLARRDRHARQLEAMDGALGAAR